MKTWTNPSVEELDVKLTASWDWPVYHENANGYFDGNQWWGSSENSGNTGNEGNEGNEGSEEGNPETSGPNS